MAKCIGSACFLSARQALQVKEIHYNSDSFETTGDWKIRRRNDPCHLASGYAPPRGGIISANLIQFPKTPILRPVSINLSLQPFDLF